MRRMASISVLGLLGAATIVSCGSSGDGAVTASGPQGGSSGAAGQGDSGGTAQSGGSNSGGTAGAGGFVQTGGQVGTGGATIDGTGGAGGSTIDGGGTGGVDGGGTGGVDGGGGFSGSGGTDGGAPDGGRIFVPSSASCTGGLMCHSESCCTSIDVPGGTFTQGGSPAVETGAHSSTVSNFALDKYDVTVGRFRNFVTAYNAGWRPTVGSGANPNVTVGDTSWQAGWDDSAGAGINLPVPGNSRIPRISTAMRPFGTWTNSPGTATQESRAINCVNWYEAFAFCIWDGGRLPTESEYEYAAAGGADNRVYPWGSAAPTMTLAVYGCQAYPGGTCVVLPVGSTPAGNGKWGHADLAGNVWQWLFDWYAPYSGSNANDYADTTPSSLRVGRGSNVELLRHVPSGGDSPQPRARAPRRRVRPALRKELAMTSKMNCRNRASLTVLLGALFLSMPGCGSNPDSTAEPNPDAGVYDPGTGGAGGTTSAGGSGGAAAGTGGATGGTGGAAGDTGGAGGSQIDGGGAGGSQIDGGGTGGSKFDGGGGGSQIDGGGTGGSKFDGGGTGDWTGFVYPKVTFTDKASTLPGSTIFASCVPNVTQMMKDQCLLIAQELYTDDKDRRVTFSTLNLFLQDDPTGVAAKWNNGPTDISIGVSAQYIEKFYNHYGCDLVLKEVRGILSHEGTHGYQWNPKNCGAYDGASTFWGFIEGEADGVRAELTNWTPTRYPSKGGNWNGGYTIGGFFFSWCKHNKKPTFLIELNHAARDMPTFTWDAAFQQILGQSVQSVWDEYQATLP